ncbi:MAG: AAA family ATPase [Fimbriimonadales bacterium]|nr:AAA family ATPase [Fimbriimonadales bacterium]
MERTNEELLELLNALPPVVRDRIIQSPDCDRLIEVVLDYGRPAEIRYTDRFERLDDYVVSEDDIRFVTERVGEFGGDNRAGIERTLHRISAIRNRTGRVVGLTCRVGRAIQGTLDMIHDIVETNKSILFLGKPGVGKTTKLREVARTLADDFKKRVVIVDTSNEIAGDGDIPHPAIGSARRMQVSDPSAQHQVMIEAVENHMPEVVVIDEIGTEMEAYAARTIAERGVQLVGTAHGRTLENLMLNPTLSDLIGGIQTVTLSDEEAKRRGTQKSVLERKAPPTFDVIVELIDYDKLAVHHDVQRTVDAILRGMQPQPEIRVRTQTGEFEVVAKSRVPEPMEPVRRQVEKTREPLAPVIAQRQTQTNGEAKPLTRVMRVYPYGIARTRLERAIREKKAPVVISNDLSDADAVIAMRSSLQKKPAKLRERLGRSIPTIAIKSNTLAQIATALDDLLKGGANDPEVEEMTREEVLEAIEFVRAKGKAYELQPAGPTIRKMQHQIAESHRLRSEAVGRDPNRRVRILPVGA